MKEIRPNIRSASLDRLLDRCTRNGDLPVMNVLSSWWCRLALALQFAVFGLAKCESVEPLTLPELRQAHSQLRAASSNIQGEFRVFRSEAANPAALKELPAELGIPLIKSGQVWRSKEGIRADFKRYDSKSKIAKESQHSVAISGGKVYEFSSTDINLGLLRVYDDGTPEAVPMTRFVESTFYQTLDALWSSGGTAFADMLQRPSTTLVPNQSEVLKGGYSLLISLDDGSKGQYELEPTKYHPFGYCANSAGATKVERRVFSSEGEGLVLPTRIVDVVWFTPDSGYTQVVMLDLKPLDGQSPIARRISADSFQDLGIGYQVYYFKKAQEEEIGERYERRPIGSSSQSGFRNYFMWTNGVLIILVLAYLFYRYGIKQKK